MIFSWGNAFLKKPMVKRLCGKIKNRLRGKSGAGGAVEKGLDLGEKPEKHTSGPKEAAEKGSCGSTKLAGAEARY
jgi:hypothetical protein